MSKELEDISQTLLQIYQKNLTFLEESFPELFTRIEEFSEELNSNKRKEKYTLEFKDGYFDILNLENNGMYYHINSYEDADQRKETMNFSTESSLELLRKNQFTKKLLVSPSYKDVMPVIDYINDTVDLENIEYEKIFKIIYISTGLGFHIQEINKKLNPSTTLVIEPELEIFRLSLFVTDYTIFEKNNKKLFLSVEEDKLERTFTLTQFFNFQEYLNFNIKHYSLLESNHYLREEVIDFFGSNSATSFPYKLVVENLHKTISFMKNKEKFLSAELTQKHNILKNKKVLIISAGPSLDNYIEYIKDIQNEFIIICVDVITRKLEKNNIIPDIIVSIDPSPLCADFLTMENKDFLKNSTLILLSQQAKEVIEEIKDYNYYFSQVLPLVEEIGYFGSTPNVGTYSFDMAIMLGAKELYLIGNDAAFDQKSGQRYAEDSSNTISDHIHENNEKDTFSYSDVIEVKGNLRKKIKSNKELLTFRNDYESRVQNHKGIFEYKAYNLSDGAYIEGLEPMTFESFKKQITGENQKIDIVNSLNKITTVIEDINYEKEIKLFVNIIHRTKKFQNKKYKSKNDFLEHKLELMIWILEKTKDKSNSVFSNLFLRYTALADIYVNFILNLRQSDLHSKESINKISSMWAKGVVMLFKDIKKAVKED